MLAQDILRAPFVQAGSSVKILIKIVKSLRCICMADSGLNGSYAVGTSVIAICTAQFGGKYKRTFFGQDIRGVHPKWKGS